MATEVIVDQENHLGEWVRNLRRELGINQRSLADAAGISRSYLCDIERGRGTQPSVQTMDKLADALGASRTDLMRAAGLIESEGGMRVSDEERRLLAAFRDLSSEGQRTVVKYARFVHADEHTVVQAVLIPEVEAPPRPMRDPRMPTLFDVGDD